MIGSAISPAIRAAIRPATGRQYGRVVDVFAELGGIWLSTDALTTTTRTGARKSIFDSSEVAANTTDAFVYNGIPLVWSMAGATLLLPNTSQNVSVVGASTDRTLTATANTQCRNEQAGTPFDGFSCLTTVVDISASTAAFVGLGHFNGSSDAWVAVDTSDGSVIHNGNFTNFGSSFISPTKVFLWASRSVAASNANEIRKVAVGANATFSSAVIGSTAVIQDLRMVNAPSPYPAFPAGSAAGVSYGGDVITASPTWPSVGTLFMAVVQYYHSTVHPTTGFARAII